MRRESQEVKNSEVVMWRVHLGGEVVKGARRDGVGLTVRGARV